MAAEAWSQIKQSTIKNCWKHTGILVKSISPSTELPIDPSLLQAEKRSAANAFVDTAVASLDEALARLAVTHIGEKEILTTEEWLDMEAEEITEGVWMDADIVEQVEFNKCEAKGEHIPELDDYDRQADMDSDRKTISHADALTALKTLDNFLLENPMAQSDQHLSINRQLKAQLHWEVTNGLSQSQLHSLFEPSNSNRLSLD